MTKNKKGIVVFSLGSLEASFSEEAITNKEQAEEDASTILLYSSYHGIAIIEETEEHPAMTTSKKRTIQKTSPYYQQTNTFRTKLL